MAREGKRNLEHLLGEGEGVGDVGQRKVGGHRGVVRRFSAAAMRVPAPYNKKNARGMETWRGWF